MKDRTLGFLAVLAFLLFYVITIAVKTVPSLTTWELQGSWWANQLQVGEPLDSLLVGASLYGREDVWVSLVALMFLFGDRRTKLVALGLGGLFIAGIAAGAVAKEIVARARPDQFYTTSSVGILTSSPVPIMRIPFETDYSFPSGHAVIVSIGAVYSLLAFRRKWVASLLFVEALLVCFSRLYLFEHFPTDVIAGFALGSAISLAGMVVEKRSLRKQGEALADYLVKLLRDGPLKV